MHQGFEEASILRLIPDRAEQRLSEPVVVVDARRLVECIWLRRLLSEGANIAELRRLFGNMLKHCMFQVNLEHHLGVLFVEFFAEFSSELTQKVVVILLFKFHHLDSLELVPLGHHRNLRAFIVPRCVELVAPQAHDHTLLRVYLQKHAIILSQ